MAAGFPYPNLFDGTLDGTTDINDKFASTESPKLKFNYFTRFIFRQNTPDRQSLGGLTLDSNWLALKQTGRLTPVINYQDVNYYGFRTKVATKTDYSVLNMTMYDDSANRAHSIVDAYMQAVSPLAQEAPNPNSVTNFQTIQALENGNELGVIEEINVLHTSINQDTIYRFYNPKITNILMDELDMTVSDASTITMSFVYDGYQVFKF
jgi:hypothetical protein